ncbi:hypothetical protein ACH5RR_022953 [Cinchona calisaya]|uniref:Uncharacterized protein n=1 Tax=Cinchona calisaya TaxID=153742 RepID=A0ABD2Z987_9GENT
MRSSANWDFEVKGSILRDHGKLECPEKRRNMDRTAEIFAQEAGVNTNASPVSDYTPEGFLLDWWRILFDTYSSRLPQAGAVESSSEAVAATANELPDFPAIVQMQPNPFIASLPRPEMNKQIMSGMSMPDASANFPAQSPIQSSDNSRQQKGATLKRIEQPPNSEEIQKQQLAREAQERERKDLSPL